MSRRTADFRARAKALKMASSMAKKYNWASCAGGKWEIDFDTNDIYLFP